MQHQQMLGANRGATCRGARNAFGVARIRLDVRAAAAAAIDSKASTKKPNFPFTKIQGQEEVSRIHCPTPFKISSTDAGYVMC
jgi:hypothetical protein